MLCHCCSFTFLLLCHCYAFVLLFLHVVISLTLPRCTIVLLFCCSFNYMYHAYYPLYLLSLFLFAPCVWLVFPPPKSTCIGNCEMWSLINKLGQNAFKGATSVTLHWNYMSFFPKFFFHMNDFFNVFLQLVTKYD